MFIGSDEFRVSGILASFGHMQLGNYQSTTKSGATISSTYELHWRLIEKGTPLHMVWTGTVDCEPCAIDLLLYQYFIWSPGSSSFLSGWLDINCRKHSYWTAPRFLLNRLWISSFRESNQKSESKIWGLFWSNKELHDTLLWIKLKSD